MAREYKLNRQSNSSRVAGIDYRSALNAEQYAAVSSPPGRALVIAGAGSGKTRTLTYRVAWLLEHSVESRNILLLTFTNKAAREMTERVRELAPHDISDLWSGTFHSVGNRLLRRHAEELGYTRSFSILDRDDQKSLLGPLIAACGIDTKQRRFPKPELLASIFSLARNTGGTMQDILDGRYAYLVEWMDEIMRVNEAYTAKKLEVNSMDFDDLLVLTVRLFHDRPELLELYRKKFTHILVDEYQDTNSVQGELVDLLAGEHNSLMAVGDDAQSIYSWRGADMDHILSFPERYPGCMVFTIDTNYRSVPEVLDLSNAAIRANRGRFEKDLRAFRTSAGEKPALIPVNDPGMQARFVAQRIGELHEDGIPLKEMAVLYRAHFQSLEIQMELTRCGIPFSITSGLRFFEQAHIKDISAFLRFATNRRDEPSFKRIAELLPGVGPASADKLWREWLSTGIPAREQPPENWSEVLMKFHVPRKAEKHWEQMAYTLDELTPGGEYARPADMIYSVLEGFVDESMKASFDNYEIRRADIEQLQSYADSFDDINEFLAQLSLMGSVDGGPGAKDAPENGDVATLSSIHQSKGLEWKAVFLVWLADGQFPNFRVLEDEDEAALEEERRLFYVALTRAKDHLYLIYPMTNPKSHTGDVILRPSRFLDDFPSDLVEEWEIGGNTRGGADGWGDEPF